MRQQRQQHAVVLLLFLLLENHILLDKCIVSCGVAKGILVKEIDALDGLMANKVIDQSGWLLVKEI